MERLKVFLKQRARLWLVSAVVVVGVPTIQAWWGMFFDTPMIPTLVGEVSATGAFSRVPWVVLLPPVAAIGLLWFAIGSALKENLQKPFVPNPHERAAGYDGGAILLTISNGVPAMFRRCYVKIISYTVLGGVEQFTDGLPQRGEYLPWSMNGGTPATRVVFESLGNEDFIVAKWERKTPGRFVIPNGTNSERSLELNRQYRMVVEVGSEATPSLPSRIQLDISAKDDRPTVHNIILLDP